jgi:hypothetical protein
MTAVDQRIVELEVEARHHPDGLLPTEKMQALAYLYEHAHGDTREAQAARIGDLRRAAIA